jgi:hypothetical protein
MIGLVFFYQGKTLLFAIEIINGMQLRVNRKALARCGWAFRVIFGMAVGRIF